MKKMIADTYVSDRGWSCRSLSLKHEAVAVSDVRLQVLKDGEFTAVAVERVEEH